jgi:Tfp pilus assembly protein PilF
MSPRRDAPLLAAVQIMLVAAMFISVVMFALFEFKNHTAPQLIRFDNAEKALIDGRVADAKKEFDTALKFRPTDIIVYASIVQSCEKSNRAELAAEYAQRGVDACREQPVEERLQLFDMLIAAYTQLDHPPDQHRAIEAARSALALAPDNHLMQNALGFLLADNATGPGKDVDESLQILKDALNGIKKGPTSPEEAQLGPTFLAETEDSYGWALYKDGKYGDAISELSDALQDYPHYPDKVPAEAVKVSYFHLGMAFTKLGQPDQALNSFNSALAYDPHFSDALAGVATLKSTSVPTAAPSAQHTGAFPSAPLPSESKKK